MIQEVLRLPQFEHNMLGTVIFTPVRKDSVLMWRKWASLILWQKVAMCTQQGRDMCVLMKFYWKAFLEWKQDFCIEGSVLSWTFEMFNVSWNVHLLLRWQRLPFGASVGFSPLLSGHHLLLHNYLNKCFSTGVVLQTMLFLLNCTWSIAQFNLEVDFYGIWRFLW